MLSSTSRGPVTSAIPPVESVMTGKAQPLPTKSSLIPAPGAGNAGASAHW